MVLYFLILDIFLTSIAISNAVVNCELIISPCA